MSDAAGPRQNHSHSMIGDLLETVSRNVRDPDAAPSGLVDRDIVEPDAEARDDLQVR